MCHIECLAGPQVRNTAYLEVSDQGEEAAGVPDRSFERLRVRQLPHQLRRKPRAQLQVTWS